MKQQSVIIDLAAVNRASELFEILVGDLRALEYEGLGLTTA